MRTTRDFQAETDPDRLRVFGSLRRMAISLTAKALWQLVGFRMPGGDSETLNAEPFTGIGVSARPPANGAPEAIVIMVGGSKSPAIVAVRDEKTRAAIAGALLQDETMLFNSQVMVYLKSDQTIEARTAGGIAVALALKSDVENVDSKYDGHLHGAAGAPTTGPLSAYIPGAPPVAVPLLPATITGTTVLKGE